MRHSCCIKNNNPRVIHNRFMTELADKTKWIRPGLQQCRYSATTGRKVFYLGVSCSRFVQTEAHEVRLIGRIQFERNSRSCNKYQARYYQRSGFTGRTTYAHKAKRNA